MNTQYHHAAHTLTLSNPMRSSASVTNAASNNARTCVFFTANNGITSVVAAAFSFTASGSYSSDLRFNGRRWRLQARRARLLNSCEEVRVRLVQRMQRGEANLKHWFAAVDTQRSRLQRN